MNTWSLNLLKELLKPINTYNLSDEVYDYIRIVSLNDIKYEQKASNVLFFMSYSVLEELNNGFIINSFDYREKANEIIKNNPKYTFVIDEKTYSNLNNKSLKAKLIVVKNIRDGIDKLFDYVNNSKRAQVIAVTGSVGKTTTVGLIAEVLKQKYNILRIYSKRITPLILKANVINFVNDKIDYIVLEMSIYHPNHVEILSSLLKPDIAALINVLSSHLEFFNSIDDICKYKASIFRYAKVGYYNNEDDLISNLKLENNKLYYQDEMIYDTKMLKFLPIIDDYQLKGDTLIYQGHKFHLFMATNLSIVQILLAYKIGLSLNIENDLMVTAINNYIPVENRINKQKAFNRDIIFDGDITTNERIKQLSEHNYSKCYLVIRKFGSKENNKRFEYILNYLNNFTKVYVFHDVEYLKMFKKHPIVTIVKNHDFFKNLDDGVIIYHYSGYYRSFKEFDEKNLLKIENKKYKIMKPEEK